MTNARSIHIGLNHVDPDAYNGWDGELSGCINDATDMKSIADGLGYTSTIITDSDATSCRVISEIGQAADELQSGDILFLSYSGHGGQVDDVNSDEDDSLDETWVLYDRQLIDDELYCLWSRFRAGVRVIVLSDSCHSGTVLRMYQTAEDLTREMLGAKEAPTTQQKATLDAISKTLGIDSDFPLARARGAKKVSARAMASPRSRGGPATMLQSNPFGVPKRIPSDVQALVNDKYREVHAAAQYMAGASERAVVSASVILISGCQDNQLSMDGSGNGLFTEKLKQVWNDGAFTGNYKAFCDAIKTLMPAKQQPNYYPVGAKNAVFEGQTPFEIGDGAAAPAQPTDEGTTEPAQPAETDQPEPDDTSQPTESSDPQLSEGDSGDAVRELQQLLTKSGDYNGDIDGDFDALTGSAVRSFQQKTGLEVTGIVDDQTWSSLREAAELEPA